MIKSFEMKKKWLFYSISGLLMFGMGLSIVGESIILKYNQSDDWFLWGAFALIITNSGLCFFGQAVIEKVKIVINLDK